MSASRIPAFLVPGVVALAALLAPAVALSAGAPEGYQITGEWKIGGTGGWDYVTIDTTRHRLFITRGDHVDVIDTTTGRASGRIPGTVGVHGVALAGDLRRGFTSNGKGNSVTEFDLDNLAVLRVVPIPGNNPDAILYESAGKRLYLFNGGSQDAVVLDATTLAVVARLPMPGRPEFAQDDGKGHIYVNIESEHGQLVRIDTTKVTVDATWRLPGCASPSGLALDRIHGRLFSTCEGQFLAVTDAESGKQVAHVRIGDGPDAAEFDTERHLVFSSNGDGTLTVIRQDSPDRYHVAAQVPTRRGARTMAFDPATRSVYLVTADFGPAPDPSPERPHPRPVPRPDTFTILIATPR